MTEAEAVKLIDERMCFGRGKWSKHHMPEIDDYWKAGQMAIKALKQPMRKRGEWIIRKAPKGYVDYMMCSNCHTEFVRDDEYYYCPNCGADMRGERNE